MDFCIREKAKLSCNGLADIGLNQEGIAQAHQAGKILKGHNIKVIVASPMLRTRETAHIINQYLNLPIIYHPGLVEADFKLKSGEIINSIKRRNWLNGEQIDGVESLLDFQLRIHNTITEILNEYDNILIVGHGLYFINMTILLNNEYKKAYNASPLYFKRIDSSSRLYNIESLK